MEELYSTVYTELRQIAAWHLSSLEHKITLDATDLVHDAVARVLKQRTADWAEESHLLAITAIMIRRVLLNHLRDRSALIRGGQAVTGPMFDEPQARDRVPELEFLALNDALDKLERIDERQTRIVEMKYFGGLTTRDIASYLGISERSVQLGWNHARLWLSRELSGE